MTVKIEPPRPYNIKNPQEAMRLMKELRGYMRVSLTHGSDIQGREYAYDALC